MIRTVDVPGGRLHVADDGTGPPILLLHAGIADMTSWDPLVPHLVRRGYRAIRYDLRGFGRTVTEDVSYSNRADAVAILDALDIGRVALVGNSRGGHIAFDVGVEHPDRVVAVVGVGAGLGGFDTEPSDDERPWFERMEALEEADQPDVDALADLAVRLWVDGIGQSPDRVDPSIRDRVRAWEAASWAPDRVAGRPVPLDVPPNDRLDELGCPVLAIAGALDTTYIKAVAAHLEASAPDARSLILPDVAHLISMEAPDVLATAIADFLDPLDRWH